MDGLVGLARHNSGGTMFSETPTSLGVRIRLRAISIRQAKSNAYQVAVENHH